MDSLFLKSLQIIFIAEKPLSASDVDMGIILNKLINGTDHLCPNCPNTVPVRDWYGVPLKF